MPRHNETWLLRDTLAGRQKCGEAVVLICAYTSYYALGGVHGAGAVKRLTRRVQNHQPTVRLGVCTLCLTEERVLMSSTATMARWPSGHRPSHSTSYLTRDLRECPPCMPCRIKPTRPHSDLWVLGTSCGPVCDGFAMYNPSASSSFQNTSSSFTIQYGQGAAAGYVATETVEMAGFSVASQGIGASAAPDALGQADLTRIMICT